MIVAMTSSGAEAGGVERREVGRVEGDEAEVPTTKSGGNDL